MSDYILSCCSTADLSAEHLAARGIEYVCFHYRLDGREYPDDLGKSMSYDKFYAAMAAGAETQTSQVSLGEYCDFFTRLLESGRDVLHVCLSSGLSGTLRSALAAADIVAPQFPERKLVIVDSLAASSGYGLLMETLADRRDAGASLDEQREWVEAHKLELHHWFFSTDLSYYVRGGRISRAEAWLGGILDICPLLDMDEEGKLTPRAKIRSKKRVIREIERKMEEHATDGLAYSGKCFLCHSACLEDARAVADLVESRFPSLQGRVVINSVGTTIGSHTGPGTVALFFWGDSRLPSA